MRHSRKIDYPELEWRWAIVLGVAVRDGLLAAVSESPKSASVVAAELGLDERATRTVLSSLVELGILSEAHGEYGLLDEHRGPLLDDGHPEYAGGRVVHRFELISKWTRIADVLVSGEPAEDRTMSNFGGTPTMAQAMRGGAKESADQVSEVLLAKLSASPTILDVGGGPGANAESFARHGADVTVFDRPEVLEVTGKYLARAGVRATAGDMNDGLPDEVFDAIYFGNTSHMYDPGTNRELFTRMRDSLKPGGTLCIKEFVRGASPDAALFAVNMLILTSGGGTYTFEEYEEWLTDAGFEEVELVELPGRTTVLISARKPR